MYICSLVREEGVLGSGDRRISHGAPTAMSGFEVNDSGFIQRRVCERLSSVELRIDFPMREKSRGEEK